MSIGEDIRQIDEVDEATLRALAVALAPPPDFADAQEPMTGRSLPGRPAKTEGFVSHMPERIGRHALLNAEEEVALAKAIEVGVLAKERLAALSTEPSTPEQRMQMSDLRQLILEGEEAFTQFFVCNQRLVIKIAFGFSDKSNGLERDDLIQEGMLGLMQAIKMYDFAKGFKFSTFAHGRVRSAIQEATNKSGRTIRLPVHVERGIGQVSKAIKALADKGIEPTPQAISEVTGIKTKALSHIIGAMQLRVLSLSAPIKDDGSELGALITDEHAEGVTDRHDRVELRDVIKGIVTSGILTKAEVQVLCFRLGLLGNTVLGFSDIASTLNADPNRGKRAAVTRQDAEKLYLDAIDKIRAVFGPTLQDFAA